MDTGVSRETLCASVVLYLCRQQAFRQREGEIPEDGERIALWRCKH
jgi:hypothetical protein